MLLIIFMVIQPTTQYDLRARVPNKPPEDLPENVVIKSDAIVVAITLEGEISINQDPVNLNQLGTSLRYLQRPRE